MRINNSKCLFIGQVKNFIAGKNIYLILKKKNKREEERGKRKNGEREREININSKWPVSRIKACSFFSRPPLVTLYGVFGHFRALVWVRSEVYIFSRPVISQYFISLKKSGGYLVTQREIQSKSPDQAFTTLKHSEQKWNIVQSLHRQTLFISLLLVAICFFFYEDCLFLSDTVLNFFLLHMCIEYFFFPKKKR